MNENEIKDNSLSAAETTVLPAVDPSSSASAAETTVIPAVEVAQANVTAEMPAVEAPSPVAPDDSAKDEGKKKGKKQKPVKVKRTAKGWFTTVLGTIIGVSIVAGMVYLAGYYYIGTRLGDNWEQKALEMNNEGMAALKTELENFDEGKQEELKSKVEILPDIAYEVFIKPVEKVPELAPKFVDMAKTYINHMINGDEIVTMGEFQGEPVRWVVINKEEGRWLVISEKIIDAQYYGYGREQAVPWANSPIRSWLNGTFYWSAFNDEERGRIIRSDITNDQAKKLDQAGEPEFVPQDPTSDSVFLLSVNEFVEYASFDYLAKADCTEYALERGLHVIAGDECAQWYLRSQGERISPSAVTGQGKVSYAWFPTEQPGGVRPAMWITAE